MKPLHLIIASCLTISGCGNPNIFTLYRSLNPPRPDGNIVPYCILEKPTVRKESFSGEEEARSVYARAIVRDDLYRISEWTGTRVVEGVPINVTHPTDYGHDSLARYTWNLGNVIYSLEVGKYKEFPEQLIRSSILEYRSGK